MAILELRIAPDPILNTKASEVTEVNEEIRQLLHDMVESMYAYDGAGLAANQVGVLKRLFVIDIARSNEEPNPMKFINPVFTYRSTEQIEYNDGCLSVPGFFYPNSRASKVEMDYLNEHGQKQSIVAEGLLAYALQHEADHLDGKLYIEYLSSFKRLNIMRKLTKEKKISLRRKK